MHLPPQFRDEMLGLVPESVKAKEDKYVANQGELVFDDQSANDGFADGTGDNDEMTGSRRRKAAKNRALAQDMARPDQKPLVVVEDDSPVDTGVVEAKGLDTEVGRRKAVPEEQPLSKAERRRRIKEEILLAGEGEGFKGYKRRMW